jgi:hypothetical protein
MDVISIEAAVAKYPWLDPKRLLGAIYQNQCNGPIGDAVAGLVQDDDHLKRYAIRVANNNRSKG